MDNSARGSVDHATPLRRTPVRESSFAWLRMTVRKGFDPFTFRCLSSFCIFIFTLALSAGFNPVWPSAPASAQEPATVHGTHDGNWVFAGDGVAGTFSIQNDWVDRLAFAYLCEDGLNTGDFGGIYDPHAQPFPLPMRGDDFQALTGWAESAEGSVVDLDERSFATGEVTFRGRFDSQSQAHGSLEIGLNACGDVPIVLDWTAIRLSLDAIGISDYAAFNEDSGDEVGMIPAGVAVYDYSCCLHDPTFDAWPESPPVGGSHNNVWQDCGFYDKPVGNGNAVHSLEHGAVWITYLPDLPLDQIETLKQIAASSDYILVSPFGDQESPVVVTAWNHQLALDSATDPDLETFISIFEQSPEFTPEFGGTCSNGTSETTVEP